MLPNFVSSFNHWAVSNKLNSMARGILEKEMHKLHDMRIKKFDVEKIYVLADVPTKVDASDRHAQGNTSDLSQNYVDEGEFAVNEEAKKQVMQAALNKTVAMELLSELNRK